MRATVSASNIGGRHLLDGPNHFRRQLRHPGSQIGDFEHFSASAGDRTDGDGVVASKERLSTLFALVRRAHGYGKSIVAHGPPNNVLNRPLRVKSRLCLEQCDNLSCEEIVTAAMLKP